MQGVLVVEKDIHFSPSMTWYHPRPWADLRKSADILMLYFAWIGRAKVGVCGPCISWKARLTAFNSSHKDAHLSQQQPHGQ